MAPPDAETESPVENLYIAAMSRAEVVNAYSSWMTISPAEATCLEFAFEPGANVLDLGCGAGRLAARLSDECGTYLGIDASEEMIRAARRNRPEMAFVVDDIVGADFEPASVDLILLMNNVLDGVCPVVRRSKLLENCARWLRPGGALIASSHLLHGIQTRGYHIEDYHGVEVQNYRSSLADIVREFESHHLEVTVALRDYRVGFADWAYLVARRTA